jgi:hypothetical protein
MPFTFTSTGGSGEGTPGKDSLFLGTWNSVTEFLAVYQGGPVGLADGDWWAFVKDNENPNKVYVVREDPNSATGWVIDDNEHFVLTGGADTGQITFNGVYIMGAGTGSGDGVGNGTIKLLPDVALVQNQYHEDQYLIIDPTSPNHIHIRAGGVQDASTADLFLGAERTGVQVSDGSGNVTIRSKTPDLVNTYGNSNGTSNAEFIHATGADIIFGDTVRLYTGGDPFTVTSVSESEGVMTVVAAGLTFITGEAYTFTRERNPNTWIFDEDGTLYGPVMGGVKALGLLNSGNNNLELFANDANIVLQAPSGSVDISAPEININSNSVPSSLNINTYLGAIVNSNRTSTYAVEDKVVATLGDLPTGATGTFMSSDNQLIVVTNGIITTINSLN